MTGYVTDVRGRQWALPEATAWELEYTSGTPCDSFWLRCPWQPGQQLRPADWVSFTAWHDAEQVFTGLVDECELSLTKNGCVLEVSGRGMAARLLDNEALGQDYATATLADILQDHVTPYGIEVAPGADLPAVSRFSVATGSSEWTVVDEFARYYGGVAPRFDRWGRLVLTGWQDGREVQITDGSRVTDLVCRDRRYGVLSQVLVRDRYSGAIQRVEQQAACDAGIRARRVVTMPGRSSFKTMRYTGQYQLNRSAAQWERLEVTVGQPFCAWPGDLVRLQRSNWERNGTFRVVGAIVSMDEMGYRSRLELAPPEAVV